MEKWSLGKGAVSPPSIGLTSVLERLVRVEERIAVAEDLLAELDEAIEVMESSRNTPPVSDLIHST